MTPEKSEKLKQDWLKFKQDIAITSVISLFGWLILAGLHFLVHLLNPERFPTPTEGKIVAWVCGSFIVAISLKAGRQILGGWLVIILALAVVGWIGYMILKSSIALAIVAGAVIIAYVIARK